MLFGLRTIAALMILWAAMAVPAQAQSKLVAGSKWVNEVGSVLTIEKVGSNGMLSGTFLSQIGCGHGKPQPMTGWFYPGKSGGAITFSVIWRDCDSVTAWVGQYNYSSNVFSTLWYLSFAALPAWNGIAAGSDLFKPQK